MTTAETVFVKLGEAAAPSIWADVGASSLLTLLAAFLLALVSRPGTMGRLICGLAIAAGIVGAVLAIAMEIRLMDEDTANRRVAALEEKFDYRNVSIESREGHYTFTAASSDGEYITGLIFVVDEDNIAVTPLDEDTLAGLHD